ncbi:MAG TPA: EAL domain-containing protein [Xanthobacteraceae bacterium]|nr:EAL domain-containing protein [Xanthobacteraceae bacterium]
MADDGGQQPMMRLSAVYVAFCMALIAVSIGAALFLGLGVSAPQAAVVAIAALSALALYDAVARQSRHRAMVSEQIANLAGGMADLARQVGDLGRQIADLKRRLIAAEQKTDPAAEQARAAIPTITADIDELGLLVHQLAETVAAHASAIAEQQARAAAAASQPPLAATASAADAAEIKPDTARQSNTAAPAPAPVIVQSVSQEEMIAAIRQMLDGNRADLYLQPIVSLPQRRLRYYETFTRLRKDDGTLLLPGDFLAAAEQGGLLPRIDHLVLTRGAQIVRRLLSKNRDIGLICNVAAKTLADPESSQRLLKFFEANQELASALLLELPQSFWRASGPLAQATLAALGKRGVRFSMDHITDLRMDLRDLAERSIRLIKVPAQLLLADANAAPREADIHPADLADLMARCGIGLIAEQIESEATVAELLDLEVRFGQGFLFSPPRPVRADVLQAAADEEAKAHIAPDARRGEAAPPSRLANAVEDISRAGMLRRPAPGGGRA